MPRLLSGRPLREEKREMALPSTDYDGAGSGKVPGICKIAYIVFRVVR